MIKEYNNSIITGIRGEDELLNKLKCLEESYIIGVARQVAKETITLVGLNTGMMENLRSVNFTGRVTGDHIKSHFVYDEDGIAKLFKAIAKNETTLFSGEETLTVNAVIFLNEMIDEVNFGDIFVRELTIVN